MDIVLKAEDAEVKRAIDIGCGEFLLASHGHPH
jgi:hypothetical protein